MSHIMLVISSHCALDILQKAEWQDSDSSSSEDSTDEEEVGAAEGGREDLDDSEEGNGDIVI